MKQQKVLRPLLESVLHMLLLCLVTASSAELVPSFVKEPQSTVVEERGSVTLNCEVTPSIVRVRWTFKGDDLSSGSGAGYTVDNNSLQIHSFRRDRHEGVYYCVAGTSARSIRSRAAILSSPWLREFSSSSEDIYVQVTLGNTAVLPCQPPESNPKAKVLFNFNNSVIGGDDRHKMLSSGKMHIGDVRVSDQGVYRCVAVNPVSGYNTTATNTIHLQVLGAPKNDFPPIIVTNDTEVVALTGSTLLLECAGLGYPPPKIQWKKYGGFLREDRTERILGNLLIKSIEVRDEGTYICSAKNNLGHPPGKVFTVSVQAPPVVHIKNPNLVAYEGEAIVVKCTIRWQAKETSPKLEWLHNAKDLSHSVVIEGPAIAIPSVSVSDGGLYQCIASGNSGRASAVARLEVRPGSRSSPEKPEKDQPDSGSENPPIGASTDPAIPGDPTNLKVSRHGSISLPCFTPDAHHRTWWREQKLLFNQSKHSSSSDHYALTANGTLQVRNFQSKMAGEYRCEGTNQNGLTTVSATYVLSEEKGPVQSAEPKPPKGKGKGRKDKNGVRHKGRKRKKNRKKNRKNGRKREGQVKLVPPSKPTVSKLSDTSVMLNWTVPTNDGLQITFFRVQYKELKPSKGNWVTLDNIIGKAKRNHEVWHLHPGWTYKFRIAAVYTNNDNTIGPNSRRFTMAHKSKMVHRPEISPVIVEVKPFNPHQIEGSYALAVKWQYKGTDEMNVAGFSLEYKPHFSPDDYKSLPLLAPKLRHHILKNLKPATEYSIRIKAFNSAGHSKLSNTVVKKTLGNDERESGIPIFHPPIQPDKIQPVPNTGDQTAPKNTRAELTPRPIMPPLSMPTTTVTPPPQDSVYEAPRNSTESSSEMLYMVLGIVLGVMMLALIIFMVMCGIKQRQQRRMMAAMSDNVHMKYQDPAQRIYVDTLGKKYMNGGFALNGINGNVPNGHGPHHHKHGDRQKMNINVNPMSEMEVRQRADNPQYNQGNPPNQGEPPVVSDMHVPPCALRASDNNFNSIGSSNKNVDTGYHSNTDQPERVGVRSSNPTGQRSSGSRSNDSQSSTSSLPDYRHCLALQSNSEEDSFERAPRADQDTRECCSCSPHHHGDPNIELNCRGPAVRVRASAEQGRLSGSSSQGSHHQHKRRRKRRTSHEHSTRDQATNTDLSSNEGTMDHPSLTKLPSDTVISAPQQGAVCIANENSSSSSVTSEPQQWGSTNEEARVSPYDNTTDVGLHVT